LLGRHLAGANQSLREGHGDHDPRLQDPGDRQREDDRRRENRARAGDFEDVQPLKAVRDDPTDG